MSPLGSRQHSVPRLRRHALGLLAAAGLWLLVPAAVSAHAHLIQADPAPDSVIARTPAVGTFVFDEALNPALTRVRVLDSSGRDVAADRGHLAAGHDGKVWQLHLPPLRAGTYSVMWTSESATDGHVMSSFYTFRVAPSGTAARLGGVGGAQAGLAPAIDGGALAVSFFTWLGLMAQALWLGALIVELAVLAPARRRVGTAEAALAWTAAPRLWRLVRAAPPAILAALLGQMLSLALAGTGGDWLRALAPATLGGLLSSQNGSLIVLRLIALVVALRLARGVRAPSVAPLQARPWPRLRRAPYALGITAAPFVPLEMDWASVRLPLTLLAASYMFVAAFAGHAANVSPGLLWQSCTIDWLHLVCTAAWAGGMAALAYGVLPARQVLAAELRAPAVLRVLDRFSPVAYVAVGVLTLSGIYSAVHHLDAPSLLASTLYGQLLAIKLGLVGVLIAMSASHVLGLRPRIARAQARAATAEHREDALRHAATVHEGLAMLASRLRLEAVVGAGVLLATALMSQTLPARDAARTLAPNAATATTSITGTATLGDLRAQLTVAPPAVGAATFTLRLWEQGRPVDENTGAAIIHLFPADQPAMRATLTPRAHGVRFAVRGSLVAMGVWRAEVLVRTVAVNEYRTVRFEFRVGPGAHFLPAGHGGQGATATQGDAMAGM
ncbi:MAG TPA: copper resistance protein CopC [Chloroflexota bacterium]|nr:copper resistance protein CopC [Chloroflexota bacterium]